MGGIFDRVVDWLEDRGDQVLAVAAIVAAVFAVVQLWAGRPWDAAAAGVLAVLLAASGCELARSAFGGGGRTIMRRMDNQMLSGPQRRVLAYLAQASQPTIADVVDDVYHRVRGSTASAIRVVDRLVADGLVVVEPDPDEPDRFVYWQVTDKGRRLVDDLGLGI